MRNDNRNRSTIDRIERLSEQFTTVEKTIGAFFLDNKTESNLSSKNISKKLYVSEASLSRFAQKCGYKGYREFLFHYESERFARTKNLNEQAKFVLKSYQQLLDETHHLINETQMHQVAEQLSDASKICVYGMGSSGIAAQEFKLRFMRFGLNIEAICDTHIMKMNSALVNNTTLVIGFSVSGKTEEILQPLSLAKARGARTLLVTANRDNRLLEYCHHIVHIAGMGSLTGGSVISPQFPILVFADIFFAYYLNTDTFHKTEIYNSTLNAIEHPSIQNDE